MNSFPWSLHFQVYEWREEIIDIKQKILYELTPDSQSQNDKKWVADTVKNGHLFQVLEPLVILWRITLNI